MGRRCRHCRRNGYPVQVVIATEDSIFNGLPMLRLLDPDEA